MGYDQYCDLKITSRDKQFLESLTPALSQWLGPVGSPEELKDTPGLYELEVGDWNGYIYKGDGELEGDVSKFKEICPMAYREETTEGPYPHTYAYFDLLKFAASCPQVESIFLEYQGEDYDDTEQVLIEGGKAKFYQKEWVEKSVRPLPARV
jgi:hypothetical protein